MRKYSKTIQMALKGQINGGVLYLLPNIAAKLLYLIPLMFLWRVLANSGARVEMTLQQMLSYTYLNALLADLMAVQTFASSWCYEGELQRLYIRPCSIYGDLIAETAGGWIPMLLCFSLPMLCVAPLFGVSILPATAWFFPSLLLCVSLGFAVDLIFACVSIQLHGISWLAHVIRMAIVSLFSGTVIPFRLLPFGLEKLFELQPFGSLGGAPLSLFVGTGDPFQVLGLQILWNLVLWPSALIWFKKSQEKMVSFGG